MHVRTFLDFSSVSVFIAVQRNCWKDPRAKNIFFPDPTSYDSSVDQLQSALKKCAPVKLNVQRRQQRTLKRARGKRFQQIPKNAASKKRSCERHVNKRSRETDKKKKLDKRSSRSTPMRCRKFSLRWRNWGLRSQIVREKMRRSCVSALRWMSTLVRYRCFQCSTGAQNAFASFAGSHETVLPRSSCWKLCSLCRSFRHECNFKQLHCGTPLECFSHENRCMDHTQGNRVLTGLFESQWLWR